MIEKRLVQWYAVDEDRKRSSAKRQNQSQAQAGAYQEQGGQQLGLNQVSHCHAFGSPG